MQINPGEFNGQATRVEDSAETLAEVEKSAFDHRELEANAKQRKTLRRDADKVELRLALRDFAEGVRGFIRVAPLTSVIAAVVVGAAFSGRKRKVAKPRV